MIDGDIRDALLEVAHRIATRGHHVDEQLVGFCDCASRTVNKACLDSGPRFDKSCAIGGSERTDMQALHAFCSLVQHGFGFPPVSTFFYGPGIFRSAKLGAQVVAVRRFRIENKMARAAASIKRTTMTMPICVVVTCDRFMKPFSNSFSIG